MSRPSIANHDPLDAMAYLSPVDIKPKKLVCGVCGINLAFCAVQEEEEDDDDADDDCCSCSNDV